MKAPVKLTGTGRIQVVELTADGTGVGKTTSAERIRLFYEQHGIRTVLVTIESRGVIATRAKREGDIVIETELFKRAKEVPGGLAGLLRPLYLAIEAAAKSGTAVIIDWAGGQAQNRLEAWAAIQFHDSLVDLRMVGLSIIVTTNAVDRMRQAADNLTKTAEIMPGMPRALLLNARNGAFDFFPRTAAAAAYKELLAALGDGKLIEFPAVEGETLQECQNAGLGMLALYRATPGHLMAKTQLDLFTARACINEFRIFWDRSADSLQRVFRFPDEAAANG